MSDKVQNRNSFMIRMGYTLTPEEKKQFEEFAKKMGISVSALIRIAVKSYIATESQKYE